MFKSVSIISTLLVIFSFGCAKKQSAAEVEAVECYSESEMLSAGIVGGTRVLEGQSDDKNVVVIYTQKPGAPTGQLCTATALTPRVLLTAGHCVSPGDAFTIMFTKPSLSCESGFRSSVDQIRARKVIRHEGYKPEDKSNPEYVENDIALVFLEESLPSNYPTYKIADPSDLEKASDKDLYFWGFGVVRYGADKSSGLLRKTQISSMDYEIIKSRKKIHVDQDKGHGVCEGDSGGPALVRIKGEYQILGVNSYVGAGPETPMCNGESYLALANSYKSWISNRLKENYERLKE